jgi:hypothetical protein
VNFISIPQEVRGIFVIKAAVREDRKRINLTAIIKIYSIN